MNDHARLGLKYEWLQEGFYWYYSYEIKTWIGIYVTSLFVVCNRVRISNSTPWLFIHALNVKVEINPGNSYVNSFRSSDAYMRQ